MRVEVDGTVFVVNPRRVREWGTGLSYDPRTGRGYQTDDRGRRVSLISYGAFGTDIAQANALADRWRERARRAYEESGIGEN